MQPAEADIVMNDAFYDGLLGPLVQSDTDTKEQCIPIHQIQNWMLEKLMRGESITKGKFKSKKVAKAFRDTDLRVQARSIIHANLYTATVGIPRKDAEEEEADDSTEGNAPGFIVPPGNAYITDPYQRVCIPSEVGASRLSDELGYPLYCVDWRNLTVKPLVLKIYSPPGYEQEPNDLYFLFGRENGHCYYSKAKLATSASVLNILGHAKGLADAYSRLPLILTPYLKDGRKYFDDDVRIFEVPEDQEPNPDATDGQSEISPDLARRFNIGWDNKRVAHQFRGIVKNTVSQEAMLIKGIVVINEALQNCIVIRKTCIKVPRYEY